jgi:hypothetical protein
MVRTTKASINTPSETANPICLRNINSQRIGSELRYCLAGGTYWFPLYGM